MRPWWVFVALGCNGPDDGSSVGDTSTPTRYAADWDGVVELLAAECAQCHTSGSPVLFPSSLEEDVRSGAGALVVAGDPDASALWRVVVGDLDPNDFGPMPLGADRLPDAEIAHVRAWIEAGAPLPPIDGDGDGALSDVDCDDADPAAFPGAGEVCNGLDDDCDAQIDEGAADAPIWHVDADADGFGAKAGVASCAAAAGALLDGTDCDDLDATAFPGGMELCDGADDDCDGAVDDAAADAPTWFADADGDGFGDVGNTVDACSVPIGYLGDAADCDDATAASFPGAPERCDSVDHDCDGAVNEADAADAPTWFEDVDGDGFGADAAPIAACQQPQGFAKDGGDCDLLASAIHPSAPEFCDGVDSDCDALIDDAALDAGTWFLDADLDGFGGAAISACARPAGALIAGGDCDDADAGAFPGALETCADTVDRNCDGAFGAVDGDVDGFAACDECDDGDGAVNPGAIEVCDDVDNDCDGALDEAGATGSRTFFQDADGDAHGAPEVSVETCSAPAGFVSQGDDCDDGDKGVFPGAIEVCDGRDDDCDATADDAAIDAKVFFRDADADGRGRLDTPTEACAAPVGFVASSDDCDDADSTAFPGAPETCDGADDNCNTLVDESAVDASKWFRDADDDDHGNSAQSKTQCAAPSGFVASSDDCDDALATVFPGAPEVCDAVDQDCDGTPDDGAIDATTWFRDVDGDAHGVATSTADACVRPAGFSALSDDCDDANGAVFPGAFEVCDLVDQDCDGTPDDDAFDAKLWFRDQDGDAFGTSSSPQFACAQPAGFVPVSGDCDDTRSAVNPSAATDPTDTLDNDCDGLTDEDARVWSHASDVQPIFNNNCTGCHSGPFPSGSLDLSGDAFGDIVNVASTGLPSMKLVQPGSPSTSYLFHKVKGTQFDVGGTGSQMGALSPAQVETLRLWIVQGCNP